MSPRGIDRLSPYEPLLAALRVSVGICFIRYRTKHLETGGATAAPQALGVVFNRSFFNMVIMYINNNGAGFADHIEIEPETTVQQLFQKQVQGSATDYLIRVNRQPATSNQVLQPGDRVSFTPLKIEGAGTA